MLNEATCSLLRPDAQPLRLCCEAEILPSLALKQEAVNCSGVGDMHCCQVDCVIKEATSPDNLAVLYEGWTPWV